MVRTHTCSAEGLRLESDWMLAHCSHSSEWVPYGNTGEIKAVKQGTGHPNSHADGSG